MTLRWNKFLKFRVPTLVSQVQCFDVHTEFFCFKKENFFKSAHFHGSYCVPVCRLARRCGDERCLSKSTNLVAAGCPAVNSGSRKSSRTSNRTSSRTSNRTSMPHHPQIAVRRPNNFSRRESHRDRAHQLELARRFNRTFNRLVPMGVFVRVVYSHWMVT